ncbi:MAG: hypothetical protein AAGA56_30065, partial [Myxococcota bacterium]
LSAASVACHSESPPSATEDVTEIPQSGVKDQAIGNCWVYAAVGWAESLHLRYTTQELNLSESYITYFHWMEQIAGGPTGLNPVRDLDADAELKTGGFWGVAGELMLRYGILAEGDFIASEAESIRSSRQGSAKRKIAASLKDGALSTPEARRDRALVRAELNRAWELSDEVVATLEEAFGDDYNRTFLGAPVPEGSALFTADRIAVGRDGEREVTLADAIGISSSRTRFHNRRGTYAWTTKYYPESSGGRRDFQIELQRAMHREQPVLLSWLVDFAAMDGSHFRAPPTNPGRQGGHLVLAHDYQVTNVPGHGTLEAGTLVEDESILEAALAPEAQIEFIRIKNSWGADLAPDNIEGLEGYHDLYMDYLDGPITKCTARGDDKCALKRDETPFRRAIFPSTAFLRATDGTCDPELYVDNCRGDTLQWCDEGRLERFACGDADWVCGMSEELGHMDCVEPE